MKKWKRLEHRWDTRERAEREKTAAKAEAALTEAQIAERYRDWSAVWALYKDRFESDESYDAYEEAHQRYRVKHVTNQANVAFWVLYRRMLDGKTAETEPFIDYLERDVWEFGSGYAKARIIQYLKQASLTEIERERLRTVALRAVDEGNDRREFRRYGGLARAISTPELHTALRTRLKANDAGVRRRAAWMLYAMGERDAELEAWQRKSTNYSLGRIRAMIMD